MGQYPEKMAASYRYSPRPETVSYLRRFAIAVTGCARGVLWQVNESGSQLPVGGLGSKQTREMKEWYG